MRTVVTRLSGVVLASVLAVAVLTVSGVDLVAFAKPSVDNYIVSESGGAIVPGTSDVGNHCDNCLTPVTLPFAYTLYARTFTSTLVSSNGLVQFGDFNTSGANTSLPNGANSDTIVPYWDDLSTTSLTETGIFTSVTGSMPNRIFNVEWRAFENANPQSGTSNFQVRLFENQRRFDLVYGKTASNAASATIGVQGNTLSEVTQYSFNQPLAPNGTRGPSVSDGRRLVFTIDQPTAAFARGFAASPGKRGIALRWRAASVADVLGFNVWRSAATGRLQRVNPSLIAARADRSDGYSFVDRTVRPGRSYAYRLQVVRVSGPSVWAGFASARSAPR